MFCGFPRQAVAYLGGAIGFGMCCALLQSLSLADCKRMSDVSLQVLAKGCPRLRFLSLSGCDKVCTTTHPLYLLVPSTSRGPVGRVPHDLEALLGAEAGVIPNSLSVPRPEHGVCSQPSSRSLASVYLWQVTTKGVKHVARGCPNLAVLNLYRCSKVQVRSVAPVFARTYFR